MYMFLCFCVKVIINMLINYMYLNPIIPAQLITPPKTKKQPMCCVCSTVLVDEQKSYGEP